MMKLRVNLVLVLIVLNTIASTLAQDEETTPEPLESTDVYVFTENNVDETGLDRLIFVEMRTGEEAAIEVYGELYTVVDDAVMFYDYSRGRVRMAYQDGTVRDHPFIQLHPGSTRVDWVISDDGSAIAWTLTNRDTQNRLQTSTYIADMDGQSIREVFRNLDEENRTLRAVPLGISSDKSKLYMDYQPDLIGEFTPFQLYARLFEIDLETGETAFLPGEEGRCLCGADIQNDLFARLHLTEELDAFELTIYQLDGQVETSLPALSLPTAYDTGGDVLLSPDGSKAVYALSRVTDFGLPSQTIRTVFVLVDLNLMTQVALTQPIQTFVIPVGWTEDNSALLLTNPVQNGTWKINLAGGRLERIAEATYLGRLEVR